MPARTGCDRSRRTLSGVWRRSWIFRRWVSSRTTTSGARLNRPLFGKMCGSKTMAFADDLLNDAHHLATKGGKNPRQSSLRRAVSTAYYAVFHLLIADFVLNWKARDQRARLG